MAPGDHGEVGGGAEAPPQMIALTGDQFENLLARATQAATAEAHLGQLEDVTTRLITRGNEPRPVKIHFKCLDGKEPGLIGHNLDRILAHGRQLGFTEAIILAQIPNFLDEKASGIYNRLRQNTTESFARLRVAMIDGLNPPEVRQEKEDNLPFLKMDDREDFVTQESLDNWKQKIRAATGSAFPTKTIEQIEVLAARHFVNGLRAPLDHQVRCQLGEDRNWNTVTNLSEKIVHSDSRHPIQEKINGRLSK